MKRPTHNYEFLTPTFCADIMRDTVEHPDFTNRRVYASKVGRHERAFLEDRWDPYNGESIKLFKLSGVWVVVDGQNRLMGLAACGTKIRGAEFSVMRGVKPRSIYTIGTNTLPRSAADTLRILTNGEGKNTSIAGSISRMSINFEAAGGWKLLPRIPSVIGLPVDNDQIADAYEEDSLAMDVATWAAAAFHVRDCPSPSLMAFCWLILRRRNGLLVGEVDAFFEKVGDGVGIGSKTDPAYLLRIKMRGLKGRLGESSNRAKLVFYVLRAFHAAHQKENLTKLQAPKEDTKMRFVRP